ncbi:MAG: large conductance mechanosensitive channel protein MscL [bacterium]|nr:large conductance mechanosensitive channel protein MscL [bacterium]
MLKEFKEFINKGNVVDMAVGIIIGTAFGAIIKSLVGDVIMPPIGVLLGNVDFSNLFITIKGDAFNTLAEAQKAGAVTLNYGVFINTLVNFLIVAFAMFIVVKAINKMKKKKEEAPAEPTTKPCPFCFSEINIKAKKCPHCTSNVE